MSSISERKNIYIEKNIDSKNNYALLLQAYKNVELNENLLNNLYQHYKDEIVKIKDNSDFDLIFFIRFLYLLKKKNHSSYNSIFQSISELLKDERFWLTKDEKSKCYWSENHMICYLSSWYLWNQLNNIQNDRCNLLLKTYLETKARYFFYEAYSQVYNMYTLSALLNLYDFSNEINIKDMSNNCIHILCRQFLEVQLLDGSTFCSSGRTYQRYKTSSENNNYNKLMYLLSGYNQENTISPIGSFFSTSSFIPNIDYKPFTNNYEVVYQLCKVDFDKIYSKLSNDDKTLFQWSAGNYFNEYIDDTIRLMDKYNLESHSHFKIEPYNTILELFPTSLLKSSTKTLKAFTDCSDLTNISYHIYNNGTYSLTSLENYNRGKMGAQQLPWIANLGEVSVFTQSGKISSVGNLDEANANSHMPYIKQIKNMAMIMYQSYDLIKTSAKSANLDLTVYLYLDSTKLNQVVQNKNWIFANKEDSYIAIYSTTLKKDSNNNYYNDNSNQQGWMVILGDSSQYNNFDHFQNDILKNVNIQFKIVDPSGSILSKLNTSDKYYYGKIVYKNISFDMKW